MIDVIKLKINPEEEIKGKERRKIKFKEEYFYFKLKPMDLVKMVKEHKDKGLTLQVYAKNFGNLKDVYLDAEYLEGNFLRLKYKDAKTGEVKNFDIDLEKNLYKLEKFYLFISKKTIQISAGEYVRFKSGDEEKKGIIRKIYEFDDYPDDIKKQYRVANPKNLKVYKLKIETESGEKEYIWDFMIIEIFNDKTLLQQEVEKQEEWQGVKKLKRERKEEEVQMGKIRIFSKRRQK
jgi:hypothetical protein